MKKLNIKKINMAQIKENKPLKIALVAAGVLLVGFYAYTTMRPEVGIIDFYAAQGKAKVYQSVLTQRQKYENEIRTRMKADSVSLEKDAKKLEEQKAKLTPDEFRKKFQALQKRAALIQDKYRPDAERLMLASQIALKSAEKEIAMAVEKTAEQSGVKILLPVNSVLYAHKSVDLTDKFVKNLDKLVQTAAYPDPNKLAQ